jgi:hypothetical protein
VTRSAEKKARKVADREGLKVRRSIQCPRCGRKRFVQPEDGLATCGECRVLTFEVDVKRSAPRLITFEVDVKYTPGHVPTELPPVTITGGEPIHLSPDCRGYAQDQQSGHARHPAGGVRAS